MCCVPISDRVEDKERLATFARGHFGGSHQQCCESLPACAAMHEQFGNIRAVRLVLRLMENELDGTADAQTILGDEERAGSRRHFLRHTPPKRQGSLAREGLHEADGRAPIHAVQQDTRELLELSIIDGIKPSHVPG